MTSKLYVGNLSYSNSEQDLNQLFSECGVVESVKIITDRDTGRSKGFAFVEMSDQEGANKAVSTLDGKDHDGRTMKVSPARPKEQNNNRDRGRY